MATIRSYYEENPTACTYMGVTSYDWPIGPLTKEAAQADDDYAFEGYFGMSRENAALKTLIELNNKVNEFAQRMQSFADTSINANDAELYRAISLTAYEMAVDPELILHLSED